MPYFSKQVKDLWLSVRYLAKEIIGSEVFQNRDVTSCTRNNVATKSNADSGAERVPAMAPSLATRDTTATNDSLSNVTPESSATKAADDPVANNDVLAPAVGQNDTTDKENVDMVIHEDTANQDETRKSAPPTEEAEKQEEGPIPPTGEDEKEVAGAIPPTRGAAENPPTSEAEKPVAEAVPPTREAAENPPTSEAEKPVAGAVPPTDNEKQEVITQGKPVTAD